MLREIPYLVERIPHRQLDLAQRSARRKFHPDVEKMILEPGKRNRVANCRRRRGDPTLLGAKREGPETRRLQKNQQKPGPRLFDHAFAEAPRGLLLPDMAEPVPNSFNRAGSFS